MYRSKEWNGNCQVQAALGEEGKGEMLMKVHQFQLYMMNE